MLWCKKTIKTWDINVDDIVVSNKVKTKTNSKYLVWYLVEVKRPLVVMLPKMDGYVKTFKVKDRDNIKTMNRYPYR